MLIWISPSSVDSGRLGENPIIGDIGFAIQTPVCKPNNGGSTGLISFDWSNIPHDV